MEIDILNKLWELGPTFAMMGLAIWYFYKVNSKLQTALDNKDIKIEALNAELRTFMENNINKAHDAINNNTIAFNALKEVLVKK